MDDAETRPAGTRIPVDEVPFLRLTSAHGEVFETESIYRQRLIALEAEAKKAVEAKRQVFEAHLVALATAHGIPRERITQWDKDTCELILS